MYSKIFVLYFYNVKKISLFLVLILQYMIHTSVKYSFNYVSSNVNVLDLVSDGMKFKAKLLFILSLIALWFLLRGLIYYEDTPSPEHHINFEDFNNVTGVKSLIIPNKVHYIQFDKKTISFVSFICVCSSFYNQNPAKIYLHTNVKLHGKYYNLLVKLLGPVLIVNQFEKPTHVFGQKLSSVHHSADVARIKILIKYGGIILDQDVFVVRNLDRFRHFELAIGWPEKQNIGSQVIMAHKDARFLGLYLSLYHDYKPSMWYYNAGESPTKNILESKPELVHRLKTEFGVENLAENLYQKHWEGWRQRFTIHLLDGHKNYLTNTGDIEANNYKDCDCTVSDMIQTIVDNLELDNVVIDGDISGNKDDIKILNFINGQSPSLLHKYFTKDAFETLKHLKTETYKTTLEDIVKSGLAHPDSHLGLYAPDVESYSVFKKLFEPVIRDYHKVKGRLQHPASNWEDKEGKIGVFPGNFVKSTRIRIARNLEGYPLNSKMSKEDYLRLEKEVRNVLEALTGDLSGTYLSLSEMSPVDQEKLVSDHLMFAECDEYLLDGGACQHWPHGRGIFLNKDRTFVVWVGEEDHLRIISIETGAHLGSVFRRLSKAINILDSNLQFVTSPSLGYLTYCPSNLGSTLRASVHISLPHYFHRQDIQRDAEPLGLQVRGAGGEHRGEGGGVWDLSNIRRLGMSETEIVSSVFISVSKLIKMEEEKLD